MSDSGDYEYDMVEQVLTDDALEAFILGIPHPGWQSDEALATFAAGVDAGVNSAAPSPNHALVQLFWNGASATSGGAPASMPRQRRSMRRLVPGLAVFALTALGAGTAGAAGALPEPAQRVVARVVEALSPFELPEPGAGRPPGPAPVSDVPVGHDRPVLPETSSITAVPGGAGVTPQRSAPSGPPAPASAVTPADSTADVPRQPPARPPVEPAVSPPTAPARGSSPVDDRPAPASGLTENTRPTGDSGRPVSDPAPPVAGGTAPAGARQSPVR